MYSQYKSGRALALIGVLYSLVVWVYYHQPNCTCQLYLGQLYLCVDCKNYQPSQTSARIESAKRARVALMKTVETGLNQIIQVNDGNLMTSVAYQDQFWFRTSNYHPPLLIKFVWRALQIEVAKHQSRFRPGRGHWYAPTCSPAPPPCLLLLLLCTCALQYQRCFSPTKS